MGASTSATDKSIVLFGGSLRRELGAQVNGQVQHYDNANWSGSIPWGAGHLFRQPLWWGVSLIGWLVQRRVDTLIVTGATTSGCVRATVVDAMSHNFRTIVATDCVGDRALGPHDANLFDMGQKYADLMSGTEIAARFTKT